MDDARSQEKSAPFASVEYELTDAVARQLALDLVMLRMTAPRVRFPALGELRPVVVLLGAALQLVVAMAVLLFFGGWQWIVGKFLIVAGVAVTVILLWKAVFYGLPSFAAWYVGRRAIRNAQNMAHRRIRWLLYVDRLETESATAPRRTAWSEIAGMATSGQSVIVSLKSGLELAVPASALTAETRTFMAERIAGR